MTRRVNERPLDEARDRINRLLASHGGGIEVVEHDRQGHLRLRFVGMCAGCPSKPLTVAATIAPRLEGVAGVTSIEIEGARISEEAAQRLVDVGIAPRPPGWRKAS